MYAQKAFLKENLHFFNDIIFQRYVKQQQQLLSPQTCWNIERQQVFTLVYDSCGYAKKLLKIVISEILQAIFSL